MQTFCCACTQSQSKLWDLNSDSSEISELESCSDPEYANGARQFKEDHPVPQVQRQANRPTERRSAERAKRDGRLVAVEDSMQDLKEGKRKHTLNA